jgi:hypothetical protein
MYWDGSAYVRASSVAVSDPVNNYKNYIYTEDTIDISCHNETQNSYKYDLQAPPSTRHIRNKNTNSVPSSMYHNAANTTE